GGDGGGHRRVLRVIGTSSLFLLHSREFPSSFPRKRGPRAVERYARPFVRWVPTCAGMTKIGAIAGGRRQASAGAAFAAASSAAMSIFFIVIIASNTRLAAALSGLLMFSASRRGVICHE